MKTYEYLTGQATDQKLDELGREGWEVVAMCYRDGFTSPEYVLKRCREDYAAFLAEKEAVEIAKGLEEQKKIQYAVDLEINRLEGSAREQLFGRLGMSVQRVPPEALVAFKKFQRHLESLNLDSLRKFQVRLFIDNSSFEPFSFQLLDL